MTFFIQGDPQRMKERNRNFIALNLPFENEKIAEDANVVAWKTERLWLMAIDKKGSMWHGKGC